MWKVRFDAFTCYVLTGSPSREPFLFLRSHKMSSKKKSRWRALNQSHERSDWSPSPETNQSHEQGDWSPSTSAAQLAANRSNAQLSTGPRTQAGLAKSSKNALKHGLTGQTVLLDTDDIAEYERHVAEYFNDLSPVGQVETDLVISIAQTMWRLKRIPSLEEGIFALGELELAAQFEHHDPALRASLIRAAVYLKYEKQIRNLQLQETRLKRRWDKETKTLWEMQAERRKLESNSAEEPDSETISDEEFDSQFMHGGPYMDQLMARVQEIEAQRKSPNGFEFSTPEKRHAAPASPEEQAA